MGHATKAMVYAEDGASLQWTHLQSVRNGRRLDGTTGSLTAFRWVSLEVSSSLCRVAFGAMRLA